ncbi:hypothetical protein D3C85_1063920 [compost metagenome]
MLSIVTVIEPVASPLHKIVELGVNAKSGSVLGATITVDVRLHLASDASVKVNI